MKKNIKFSATRDPSLSHSVFAFDLKTLVVILLLISIPLSSLANQTAVFRLISVACLAMVATAGSLFMRSEVKSRSIRRIIFCMLLGIILYSTGSIMLTDLITRTAEWGMLLIPPIIGAFAFTMISVVGMMLVFLSLQ